MKCPYCNQEHPDDFQFCPRTGKKIEIQNKACTNKQCSAYGKYVLPIDARFCPDCGCAIAAKMNEEHNVGEKGKTKPSETATVTQNMEDIPISAYSNPLIGLISILGGGVLSSIKNKKSDKK